MSERTLRLLFAWIVLACSAPFVAALLFWVVTGECDW